MTKGPPCRFPMPKHGTAVVVPYATMLLHIGYIVQEFSLSHRRMSDHYPLMGPRRLEHLHLATLGVLDTPHG